MKKSIVIYALALTFALILAGCVASETEETTAIKEEKKSITELKEQDVEKTSEAKKPSYELYYGEWEISETIYVDSVPTRGTEYTEEEIEDAKKFYYENAEIRKIKFTPDEIVINENEIYDEIMYTYVVFPADIDYNIHFTMTLKDIGLTEDNAGYYLFVKAESGNAKTVMQFFIKDSNTIIAYCGGSHCIEYNKVSESGNDSEVLIIVG